MSSPNKFHKTRGERGRRRGKQEIINNNDNSRLRAIRKKKKFHSRTFPFYFCFPERKTGELIKDGLVIVYV